MAIGMAVKAAILFAMLAVATGQQGNGNGNGGGGQGQGGGIRQGTNHNSTDDGNMMGSGEDQVIIQAMVNGRDKITRMYNETSDGVGIIAETWSDDPQMAEWIKEHVAAMKERVETNNPIRQGDPLFAAVFEHTSELVLEVEYTEKGVLVVENGTTSCASALVKAHAAVVSAFIEKGQEETQSKHAVPEACDAENDDNTSSALGRPSFLTMPLVMMVMITVSSVPVLAGLF